MNCDKILEGIIVGVCGGSFAGIGIWALERIKEMYLFSRDEKRIIQFFTNHDKEVIDFWNTYRIASEVNLTTERVNYVCSNSLVIKRSELEKETWCKL